MACVYGARMPGATVQVFDAETGLFQNWHREYNARLGRYIQSDPIGLRGGINTFAYVGGNPLSKIDPRGLTQADVDNAFNIAKDMMPGRSFPTGVDTWSQDNKSGKHYFWDKKIYVDAKYLACLDDVTAAALVVTILHEMAHFNQPWYQFAIDNILERVTGGASSNAQDFADTTIWNNDVLLAKYQKERHLAKDTCQCRK